MCVLVLQTLSAEDNFGPGLNKKLEHQDSLPVSIRIEKFDGTLADFLISVSQPPPFSKGFERSFS